MEPFSDPIKPFWNWTITDHVKLSLGAQRVETKWQLKNFETAECGWMDGCAGALWSMGEPSLRNIHWPLLPPLKQHKQESTSLFRSVVCALHDTNGPEQTNEWTPEWTETLILGVLEVGIVIRDSNETVLNFQIFPDGGPCQIALPRVDG